MKICNDAIASDGFMFFLKLEDLMLRSPHDLLVDRHKTTPNDANDKADSTPLPCRVHQLEAEVQGIAARCVWY